MPVNPAIAMGVRPLELPDPLAQYAKLAAIQQAQNQNAMAQYQLSAAQRQETAQNALSQAYKEAYDPATGAYDPNKLRSAVIRAGAGAQLPGIEKQMGELETSRLQREKARSELLTSKLNQSRQFLDTIDPSSPDAPARFIAWHEANHADPIIGPALAARGITADQSRGRIQQAIQQGPEAFARLVAESKLGAEKFMEINAPKVVGGAVYNPITGGFTAPPRQSQLLTPEEEAQKARLAAASRAQTTVVLPPQEKAEQTARGGMLVKQYEGVAEAAKIAGKTLPALESNLAILDKGFDTGFGTEAKTAGAKVLAAFGVKDAEKYATNSQTFLANATQAVLQRQLEQKGPQTEADAQRITQTGAQLGNTKDANRFLISVAQAQLKRDIAQRNFYDKWWKTNKTYDGAEDAWYAGEGGKSLFDSPELKAYGATPQTEANRRRPGLGEIFSGKK